MQLATLDMAVIGAYAAGIFGLAQYVSRDATAAAGGRTATDYFLASRSLPWWAIGSSLIAANISAEQIIGMSGSGYAIGLAIASYEWTAALTLLIVGKYFLPIFLRNNITTMPHFLEQRYGTRIRGVMAVFWLGLYVFVNLTSILWLGSTAVHAIADVDQFYALAGLGVFALFYQLWGGLRAVALTDIVQVTLLVLGGFLIAGITLDQVGHGRGILAGFHALTAQVPDHFHMILGRDSPYYKDLPGISVLVGGLWVMHFSYWGFNQYIIQRALAARNINQARGGIVLAAFLKLLLPFIIVLPGIAAVALAPHLAKPDQAYPTMMALLPVGIRGLVFAALIAAVIASTASKINSIATIFTMDIYTKLTKDRDQRHLVGVGRIAASVAVVVAIFTARPLLGGFDQAFQFIQEYTGFFTPGIVVIFMLGFFWPRANEAGALAATVGSFLLSVAAKLALPGVAFLDRVGLVFLAALGLAVVVSLATPARAAASRIITNRADYRTTLSFNLGAAFVTAAVLGFYATWW